MTTAAQQGGDAPAAASSAYSWQRATPMTAGTLARAIAFTIDALIVFALAWTFTFVVATARFLRVPTDINVNGQPSPALGLLWLVSIFELPLLLAYFTLFEGLSGRTPGKMLVGLRVARVDGEPASLGEAFLRNLLRLLWVTPFGPAFVLLDAWSLRATELDQRMGDLAAGTVVIDGRAAAATSERL